MINQEINWFVKGVNFAKKYFSWMVKDGNVVQRKLKHYFSDEYMETLRFSGLNVDPVDVLTFAYMGAFLSFISFVVIDVIIISLYDAHGTSLDVFTISLMIIVTVFLPIFIMNLLAGYPKTYARYVKIHSLGDVPEVLSYLVMYLKLVPNLENSIKFTAKESSTSLTKDLRKMIWDMEIRVYHGIDDALTQFANQWGKWSDHFKRSLHLIRSSIQESEEAQRVITLNKALDVGLDGTRELMNQFAGRLHQPTLVIYSIGIMIPLSIIAMLPAAGLIGLKITIFQVFFIYDILLPLTVSLYIQKILLSRPATFNPPVIPKNHPTLKNIDKHQTFLRAILLGVFIAIPGLLTIYLSLVGYNDPTNPFLFGLKYCNTLFPNTLFIIWGIAGAITYYTSTIYHPYKNIRDTIKTMEKEFSDALYILGKRISEGRSPEESFVYTAETMKGSEIATMFNQTGNNLTAIHTTIDNALFNPEFGSLKYVYSDRIKATMRLFVEGIKKSQKSVSISIIRLADHLKELQQVENKIKDTLSPLTSTLRSTAAIFAPMIAGVTLAITKLIANIIEKMTNTTSTMTINAASTMYPNITEAFTLENVQPEYFILVIGLYIIELVILLTRFTNGIDEGDDKAEYMYTLGKIMPTAVTVLTVTVIISQLLFAQIINTI